MPYKQSLFHKLLDCILNGSLAKCRTKLHDLTLGKLSDLVVNRTAHRFDCGQLFINQCYTLLEITVRSQNGLQQILDKRRGIFCVLVPAFLTLLQSIVVKVLVLGNLAFKGDIPADHIAGAIQQQGSQQAAHSAVAVIERVYAEKVVNEHGYQQQSVKLLHINHTVIAFTNCINCWRCFVRGKRCKQNKLSSLCIRCADIVLGVLESSANALMGILIQITVELQDIIGRDWNKLEVLVNRIQHITVTHDFFLITVTGCCLIPYKLQQACIGRADSLNFIGRFCTLYLCNLNQSVKLCGLLLQIKLLSALVFMNLCHKPDNLTVPRTTCKFTVIEVSHTLTLLSPNYK